MKLLDPSTALLVKGIRSAVLEYLRNVFASENCYVA
jgi:hypothetical protein